MDVKKLQAKVIEELFKSGLCLANKRSNADTKTEILCIPVREGSSLLLQTNNVIFKKIILKIISFEEALSLFNKNFIENIYSVLYEFVFPEMKINPPKYQFRFNPLTEWFCFRDIKGLYSSNPYSNDMDYDVSISPRNFDYVDKLDLKSGQYAIQSGKTFDFEYYIASHNEIAMQLRYKNAMLIQHIIRVVRKWAVPIYLFKMNIPIDIGNIVKEYI